MNVRWRPYSTPWVIAHRGASGALPEHCLPGYALAIEQGADVIEPDLVASADGVLYARHDLGLARSSDVAQRSELAAWRRPGDDGSLDWWVAELSSAQIDSLRAVQPWPQRPHHRDGVFRIPRFTDILLLLLMERARRERPLLVYPELKHPGYFAERGLDLVELLARALEAHDLLGPQAPVVVQCFDADCLERVRARTGLRVVLLSVELPALDRTVVDGYGISKQALMTASGADFIARAHAAGRMVHAWTFRDDQPQAGLSPVEECKSAYAYGCDGLFSDFPATALRARCELSSTLIAQGTSVRVFTVVGNAIRPYLAALADLRIRVFRDWPYCYDGDLAYETDYLQTYSRSACSVFVLAMVGDRIVGCSTGLPLRDETSNCQAPFLAAGFDLDQVFYFGESVLDPAYRGRGIGHQFFAAREAHARSMASRYTAFCAVQRDPSDPRCPADYRPLDRFWQSRGYVRRADLVAQFEWKELADPTPVRNTMVFWLREWI